MKNVRLTVLVAMAAVSVVAARSADLPPRETIASDGWVIEFSPADRPTAEKLADRIGRLEQARSAAAAFNLEFAPAIVEARSAELAQKMADLCALPSRRKDFESELRQMAAGFTRLEEELAKAVFPRAVAVWRKSELIQRLGAGEKVAGFSFDVAANQVNFGYNPQWTLDKDYVVTKHPEAIGALPVKIPEEVTATEEAVATLEKDFQNMCSLFGTMAASGLRSQILIEMQNAAGKILEAQMPGDPSVKWISAGAARWAARQVLVQTNSPQVADRYTFLWDEALRSAMQEAKPLDLEAWPDKQDSGQRYAMAVQVFRNVAEKHGNAAITRWLGEFWRLPPAQRTSVKFRRLYEKLFREPLEAEAPAGVRFGAQQTAAGSGKP
jgi:hypothetical protein